MHLRLPVWAAQATAVLQGGYRNLRDRKLTNYFVAQSAANEDKAVRRLSLLPGLLVAHGGLMGLYFNYLIKISIINFINIFRERSKCRAATLPMAVRS